MKILKEPSVEDSFVIDSYVLCLRDRRDRALQELVVVVLLLELEAEQETTPNAVVRGRLIIVILGKPEVATEQVKMSQHRATEEQCSCGQCTQNADQPPVVPKR